jgi:hypothetical protein
MMGVRVSIRIVAMTAVLALAACGGTTDKDAYVEKPV